jgi:hypothetical protein
MVENGRAVGGGDSHYNCGTGAYEEFSPGRGQPWCDTVEVLTLLTLLTLSLILLTLVILLTLSILRTLLTLLALLTLGLL